MDRRPFSIFQIMKKNLQHLELIDKFIVKNHQMTKTVGSKENLPKLYLFFIAYLW